MQPDEIGRGGHCAPVTVRCRCTRRGAVLGERAARARLDRWQETLATVTSRPPIRAPHGLNGTLRQSTRIVCRSKEAALGIKQRRRCRRKYASCLRSARRFGLSIHTSPSLPRDPQRHRRRATCRSGFMGRHGADRAGKRAAERRPECLMDQESSMRANPE